MASMTFFLLFVPLLAFILLSVNLILAPHIPYQEKNSPFECGFHSFLGQNRIQFSISFFIFALLFLLFDLEILLVYPYVVSAYSNDIYGLVIMLIFFLALTLGFSFEIGKNALKIDSRQVFKPVKYKLDVIYIYSAVLPLLATMSLLSKIKLIFKLYKDNLTLKKLAVALIFRFLLLASFIYLESKCNLCFTQILLARIFFGVILIQGFIVIFFEKIRTLISKSSPTDFFIWASVLLLNNITVLLLFMVGLYLTGNLIFGFYGTIIALASLVSLGGIGNLESLESGFVFMDLKDILNPVPGPGPGPGTGGNNTPPGGGPGPGSGSDPGPSTGGNGNGNGNSNQNDNSQTSPVWARGAHDPGRGAEVTDIGSGIDNSRFAGLKNSVVETHRAKEPVNEFFKSNNGGYGEHGPNTFHDTPTELYKREPFDAILNERKHTMTSLGPKKANPMPLSWKDLFLKTNKGIVPYDPTKCGGNVARFYVYDQGTTRFLVELTFGPNKNMPPVSIEGKIIENPKGYKPPRNP